MFMKLFSAGSCNFGLQPKLRLCSQRTIQNGPSRSGGTGGVGKLSTSEGPEAARGGKCLPMGDVGHRCGRSWV